MQGTIHIVGCTNQTIYKLVYKFNGNNSVKMVLSILNRNFYIRHVFSKKLLITKSFFETKVKNFEYKF